MINRINADYGDGPDFDVVGIDSGKISDGYGDPASPEAHDVEAYTARLLGGGAIDKAGEILPYNPVGKPDMTNPIEK